MWVQITYEDYFGEKIKLIKILGEGFSVWNIAIVNDSDIDGRNYYGIPPVYIDLYGSIFDNVQV